MAHYSRDNRFHSALIDTEVWHAAPDNTWGDRRSGSMLRKDPRERAAYGCKNITLRPGVSRLITATLIGSGAEGVAAIVHQANLVEPAQWRDGEPHNRTVIKLRAVEKHNGKLSLLMVRTIARELTQGLAAAYLRVPFVTGISDWWLWYANTLPAPLPYHVHPLLPRPQAKFDVSDLFDPPTATEIRRRYVRMHGGHAEEGSWDRAYLTMRRRQLASGEITQLPLVVMEQANAGDDTLWALLQRERVIVRAADNWRFFSAQMRLLALMVAHLQQEYGWIHGDLSANNIILASSRRDMPPAFARLGPVARPELRGRLYVPSFIDLSRSAMRPSLTEAQFPPDVRGRQPTFRADAIAYVDGGNDFSRTADMRRVGLSLCLLIVKQTCAPAPSVTFEQLDARIVRVARLLIDVPVAWARTGDWAARRTDGHTCTARSRTFGTFLTNLLWMCDYMARIEALAAGTPAADDARYVRDRFALFAAMEIEISHDLNPFLGWLLTLHPAAVADDMRQPEIVAQWDALAL